MPDDFAADSTTTGIIRVGEKISGTLETPGDHDWFRAEVEAGQEYVAKVFEKGYGFNTLKDALLDYEDPFRTIDDFDVLGNGVLLNYREFVVLTPEGSGDFFFDISSGSNAVGTYELEFRQVVPESDLRVETPNSLKLGQPVIGYYQGQFEEDWFRVELTEGVTYRFQSNSLYGIPLGDNQLKMHDSEGEQITLPATNGALNARLDFTPTEIGTFFVISAPRASLGNYEIYYDELIAVTGTPKDDFLKAPVTDSQWPGSIDGGRGSDTISFVDLQERGVLVNLDNGLAQHYGTRFLKIAMESIENATGSSFADTLYGGAASETLRGLGGDDVFYGSAGADVIDGGAGRDVLDFLFADEGVSASLLKGRGWAGDAQGDRYAGVENLKGSLHDDFLWGDHGNNRLEGSHGDDTLVGNGGDDYILAGFGTDVVVYAGNRAEYEISHEGIRTEVRALDTDEGHDVIGHAEILRFADGDVMVSDLPM